MAWNREQDWGKEKKFREWQECQVLDTLFFDFIDVAKKLQPKIVIAENVKGLMMWEAQDYMNKIILAFNEAWYKVNYKLLDASKMWVPQRRERIFFYAIRNDLLKNINTCDLFWELPSLDLEFNEKTITLKDIIDNDYVDSECGMTEHKLKIWNKRQKGDLDFSCTLWRTENRPNSMFNNNYLYLNKPITTITSKKNDVLFDYPRHCNFKENMNAQTFPLDYNFLWTPYRYILWMSVPPLMTYWIANEIYKQWISKM